MKAQKKQCNVCGKIEKTKHSKHGYLKVTKNNDVGGSVNLEVIECGNMILIDK